MLYVLLCIYEVCIKDFRNLNINNKKTGHYSSIRTTVTIAPLQVAKRKSFSTILKINIFKVKLIFLDLNRLYLFFKPTMARDAFTISVSRDHETSKGSKTLAYLKKQMYAI